MKSPGVNAVQFLHVDVNLINQSFMSTAIELKCFGVLWERPRWWLGAVQGWGAEDVYVRLGMRHLKRLQSARTKGGEKKKKKRESGSSQEFIDTFMNFTTGVFFREDCALREPVLYTHEICDLPRA